MAKDLEFFDDFFAAPEKMKAREFYSYVHEWLEYLKEHEGEFNYLEDEDWRERKDRVLAVLTEQEELKYEFEELEERLDEVRELDADDEKIAVHQDYLAFMKRNQENYDFTDAQIKSYERSIEKLIISVLDCEIAEERLKGSKEKYQQSLNELDDSLFEHYRRTGKRPVLSALQFKFGKRLKGN